MSKESKAAEKMIEIINSLVKKGYSDDDIRRYYRMMGELIDIVETLNNRIESLENRIKVKV